MARDCPVCGRTVDHVRIEEPAGTDGPAGGGASFDIDDLCSVAESERWDRICTAAESTEEASGPTLEVYYHFFGGGDD
jgi:hypothetical protein